MPAMTETSRSRSKTPIILLSVLGGLLLILTAAYIGVAIYYGGHFLPGTTVNEYDVSGMTATRAENILENFQSSYALTISQRDGRSEAISGDSIGFSVNLDGALEEPLNAQNQWSWPLAVFGGVHDDIILETTCTYDSEKLAEIIAALDCMDTANQTAPADAYLTYDADAGRMVVVEEIQGDLVDTEKAAAAIEAAVSSFLTELDLEQSGCYAAPEITADDETLNAQAQALNPYVSVVITYEMGKDTVTLDGAAIQDWLTLDEDYSVTLDETQVAAFVRSLASTYNTIGRTRTISTSYGSEVTIEGGDLATAGDYGWWMNESAEAKELAAMILNGESGVREPVWYQTAAVLGAGASRDFGGTYVEVNLTAQHLFFYVDGELVVESDIVSGKNDATPTGVYSFTYKERYATLEGENYSSPVSWWMPFSGNVGLHDASWRSTFGGSIYKSGGSHGCINLPITVAKTIYESIDTSTTAVIVYKLDGTEGSATTSQTYEDIASAVVDAIDEIHQAGDITSGNYNAMSKKIQWARAAYSSLSSSARSLVTNYSLLLQAESDLSAYEDNR